jgi:hypothetical protein
MVHHPTRPREGGDHDRRTSHNDCRTSHNDCRTSHNDCRTSHNDCRTGHDCCSDNASAEDYRTRQQVTSRFMGSDPGSKPLSVET